MTHYPKKLIEVALPLDAINKESKREKSLQRGHPSTLHRWWARRPLASARAVIFSQLVDDPSEYVEDLLADPEKVQSTKKKLREKGEGSLRETVIEQERERLFQLIKELIVWENSNDQDILDRARGEIKNSWRRTCERNSDHPHATEIFNPEKLPAFHDPFAGGGALPLEAQRLGLKSYASDLNPVAVLINKAMIEFPPKFANQPPVRPEIAPPPPEGIRSKQPSGAQLVERGWRGTQGLAEDIRYYGEWMYREAEHRIGKFYPKVKITKDLVKDRPELQRHAGQELTVIAWIWARTVASPDPALNGIHVPLIKSLVLSNKGKGGKRKIWLEPIIQDKKGGKEFSFRVKSGNELPQDDNIKGTVDRGGARCLFTETAIPLKYIRSEGQAGHLRSRMIAMILDGKPGRIYLSPTSEMENIALGTKPNWAPSGELPEKALGFRTKNYGMVNYSDHFTNRQLLLMTTLIDLISKTRDKVRSDSSKYQEGEAYAEIISVYLTFLVSQMTNFNSSICSWNSLGEKIRDVFSRHAMAMAWDYVETNPFGGASGSFESLLQWQIRSLDAFHQTSLMVKGKAEQSDATRQDISANKVVSTDPPYYDNIGYADLSDFFYVWIRSALRSAFPKLLDTITVPKQAELIATPHRHSSKEEAEQFFLSGMRQAMIRLNKLSHPAFPVTIYYAYKQADRSNAKGGGRTGWETFLDAVLRAGFSIVGTWPMRTELSNRMIGMGANALASSVVLVCRRREEGAPEAGLGEFLGELRRDLPKALRDLQTENIAPVDLAQAAIGPGMAIYSRYSRVIDAEGEEVPVRDALARINQVLDETLAEQEGDFDPATRWALAWFEQAGFEDGEFGVAETLAKAKNTDIDHMKQAGILEAGGGRVRLRRPGEMGEPPGEFQAGDIARLSAWKTLHWLIRAFSDEGEHAAARLYRQLGAQTETARELAYRLYTICEHRKQSSDAQLYNSLIQNWNRISVLSKEAEVSGTAVDLFEEED